MARHLSVAGPLATLSAKEREFEKDWRDDEYRPFNKNKTGKNGKHSKEQE